MIDEPSVLPVAEDDNEPATKGFVRAELAELEKSLDAKLQRVMDHFDVIAENIHRDVAAANADEISLIRDKQTDHEERLAALERA